MLQSKPNRPKQKGSLEAKMTSGMRNGAWIGAVVGLLTITSYGVTSVGWIQGLSARITVLENTQTITREDLQYIKSRLDAIYDRLPKKDN